jgi:hypothetical protein
MRPAGWISWRYNDKTASMRRLMYQMNIVTLQKWPLKQGIKISTDVDVWHGCRNKRTPFGLNSLVASLAVANSSQSRHGRVQGKSRRLLLQLWINSSEWYAAHELPRRSMFMILTYLKRQKLVDVNAWLIQELEIREIRGESSSWIL